MWASVPQRARMISSMVWAVGALRLISMARMPNSNICMVAPAAYLQSWPEVALPEDQACWAALIVRQEPLMAKCRHARNLDIVQTARHLSGDRGKHSECILFTEKSAPEGPTDTIFVCHIAALEQRGRPAIERTMVCPAIWPAICLANK